MLKLAMPVNGLLKANKQVKEIILLNNNNKHIPNRAFNKLKHKQKCKAAAAATITTTTTI